MHDLISIKNYNYRRKKELLLVLDQGHSVCFYCAHKKHASAVLLMFTYSVFTYVTADLFCIAKKKKEKVLPFLSLFFFELRERRSGRKFYDWLIL